MGQVYSSSDNNAFVQWDRDSVSDCCSYCSVKFTTLNRRHHCRSCGVLICHACSPYTAWLPQLGYDPDIPQRVCSFCASKALNIIELEVEAFNICGSKNWKEDAPDLDRISKVFKSAKTLPAFNSYLLDKLRTQFAVLAKGNISQCIYSLSKTGSITDHASAVAECSHMHDICSRFKDDLELDLSQFTSSLAAAKDRLLTPRPHSQIGTPNRRQSSPVIRVKKVRFAAFEVSSPVSKSASSVPGRIRTKRRLQRISIGVPQSVHARTSTIVC